MHILTFKDIYADRPIIVPIGLKGRVRMDAIHKFSGKRRVLANWFPNKVLDAGRNYIGSNNSWIQACQVGTDNTPPSASDTGLGAYHAGTSTIQYDLDGAQASSPYFGWLRRTYRFPVGATAANLSEAGFGWATGAGANLFSRCLIVDGTGTPTTVTPLADEILDVTYELRYYPPLSDVNGTIVLNSITYDTIVRASLVNSSTWQSDNIGIAKMGVRWSGDGSWFNAYDGNLGTLIQSPSGSSANLSSGTPYDRAYGNNDYYIDMVVPAGTTAWVLGAGIRSVVISTNMGRFQTQFDAQGTGNRIPKTGGNTLELEWRVSWIEGTIP